MHELSIRVYYEDTDFSGLVYHTNYLKFMERGRTELLRSLSFTQSDLYDESGALAFVVKSMSLDFVRPARMDDLITVVTRSIEMRGASWRLAQEVRRGDEVLVRAEVTVAAIRGGQAVRIPEKVRDALSRFESSREFVEQRLS